MESIASLAAAHQDGVASSAKRTLHIASLLLAKMTHNVSTCSKITSVSAHLEPTENNVKLLQTVVLEIHV